VLRRRVDTSVESWVDQVAGEDRRAADDDESFG
jgi:hypothetical protein